MSIMFNSHLLISQCKISAVGFPERIKINDFYDTEVGFVPWMCEQNMKK